MTEIQQKIQSGDMEAAKKAGEISQKFMEHSQKDEAFFEKFNDAQRKRLEDMAKKIPQPK